MRNIILNLRNKPESVRRHILHILTVAFGVVLLFLWVYSLGTSLTDKSTQAKISNDLKPLSALKANIVDGYKSISGSSELNVE